MVKGKVPERFIGSHWKCDGPNGARGFESRPFRQIRARRLMDRATAFYVVLCGFESRRARHICDPVAQLKRAAAS